MVIVARRAHKGTLMEAGYATIQRSNVVVSAEPTRGKVQGGVRSDRVLELCRIAWSDWRRLT